ncbi:hypothetical protein BDV59DRAFT_176291 [Aspergillus ambiguus]|uniref:uncharacterized protein n=1 Tax=Aspergillus ambiguus TaxID=176160 RepID=UPI003CCDCB6A
MLQDVGGTVPPNTDHVRINYPRVFLPRAFSCLLYLACPPERGQQSSLRRPKER